MKRRDLAIPLGLFAVLALAGLTCRGREPGSVAPEHAATPSATGSARADGSVRRPDAEPVGTPDVGAAHAAVDDDAGGTFARVTQRYREHDLRLLAEIRREQGGEVPRSIERLLELRDAGATRDRLAAHIDTEIDGIVAKVAARRWLGRELGDPPPSHESGTGPRAVAPIERRPDAGP
jgi:hypothetical protein